MTVMPEIAQTVWMLAHRFYVERGIKAGWVQMSPEFFRDLAAATSYELVLRPDTTKTVFGLEIEIIPGQVLTVGRRRESLKITDALTGLGETHRTTEGG